LTHATKTYEPLCGANISWVDQTVARFQSQYIGSDGLIISALQGNGAIADATPLIADFGDVFPFLHAWNCNAFIEQQISKASAYLKKDLFEHNGFVSLFLNHDWLLGLLELYRLTGNAEYIERATRASHTIINNYFVNDVLVDSLPSIKRPKSLLCPATSFNVGYVELWLELHDITGDELLLEASTRLARTWIETDDFIRHGFFPRILSSHSHHLDKALRFASKNRALLFKDNTNCIWSILALYQKTGEPYWQEAIECWIDGFETHFFNNGDVYLYLDQSLKGQSPALRAAFSVIDFMCDYAIATGSTRTEKLACRIADRWLTYQWPSGLFPESGDADHDHLDCNVDMAIALTKLSGINDRRSYLEAAQKTAKAIIAHHRTDLGYCLSVKKDGSPYDSRIIIKFQALMLKLALTPANGQAVLADSSLLYLLRDR
tara:strand:- start:11768 stop:13069 length:1302 start_codon:yes stop_codon:yes gene_type:complete